MFMNGCVDMCKSSVAICESEEIPLAKKTSRLDLSYHIGIDLLKWLCCVLLRFPIIFFCCFQTHLTGVAEEGVFDSIICEGYIKFL